MLETDHTSSSERFQDWYISVGSKLSLTENSLRNILQLFEDINKGEAHVYKAENGEWIRTTTAVGIHVYFVTENADRYKLHETRYKLNKDGLLEDFLDGNIEAASLSSMRTSPFSVTERINPFKEKPITGMVRGLRQELFSATGEKSLTQNYPSLDDFLASKLRYLNHYTKTRGAFDKNNSYQGISSRLTMHVGEIVFTPGMPVPIQTDQDGTPQFLYEYIPEDGFENLFTWKKI